MSNTSRHHVKLNTSKPTFVVDIDDTLMPNAHFYFRARALAFVTLTHANPRLCSLDSFLAHVHDADNQLYSLHGLSMQRFPAALWQAATNYAYEKGELLDESYKGKFTQIGFDVFKESNFGTFLPGAKETLDYIASMDHPIIFFTEGDTVVQTRKVRALRLESYGHVEIVPKKDVNSYLWLAGKRGFDPNSAVMIGNSLHSDILPAVQANYGTVFIPFDARVANKHLTEQIPAGPKHKSLKSIADFAGVYQSIKSAFE